MGINKWVIWSLFIHSVEGMKKKNRGRGLNEKYKI